MSKPPRSSKSHKTKPHLKSYNESVFSMEKIDENSDHIVDVEQRSRATTNQLPPLPPQLDLSSLERSRSWGGYARKNSKGKKVGDIFPSPGRAFRISGNSAQSPTTFFPVNEGDLVFGISADGKAVWSRQSNFKTEIEQEDEEQVWSAIEPAENNKEFHSSSSDFNPILGVYDPLPESFETTTTAKHLDKLRDLFQMFDIDGDGKLSKEDLLKALSNSAATNKVKIDPIKVDKLVNLIMHEADLDNNGYLEFEEFSALLYGLKNQGGKRSFLGWLPSFHSVTSFKDPVDDMPRNPTMKHWFQGLFFSKRFRGAVKFYISNNWKQALLIAVWLTLCFIFFWWKFTVFMHHPLFEIAGLWLPFSKGSAEVIKLNMALLLLAVCKSTMTFLRETILGRIIPFDDRLEFHKLAVGMVIFASFTHTLGFYAGTYRLVSSASPEEYTEVLEEITKTEIETPKEPPTYAQLSVNIDSWTGYVLWAVLIALSLIALKAVRRSMFKNHYFKSLGGFGAFWWSHLILFPVFYVFTFYHGSDYWFDHFPNTTTWIYLVVPTTIYLLERANKLLLSRTTGKMDVIEAEILPGKVLALQFSAPPFQYRSGMYIFIQVPSISAFEWHPFSITSAPSDFSLSIHMRAVGDWTNAMLEFWESHIRKAKSLPSFDIEGANLVKKVGRRVYPTRYKYPKVLVNGPFGAPAQDYESFRVIMLVGAGIGVTPFASVIRDVLHKSKNQKKYPRFRVEKVYFYWTTREQGSFQWFSDIMNKAKDEDEYGIIEMHNYLTSAYGDDDPKSFVLKTFQELNFKKEGVDFISNTKTTTHFSRPKWEDIFSKVKEENPHTTIGVFYCGPPALQKELNKMCRTHTVNVTNNTSFVFKKENF